jgi:hypothetical protein
VWFEDAMPEQDAQPEAVPLIASASVETYLKDRSRENEEVPEGSNAQRDFQNTKRLGAL